MAQHSLDEEEGDENRIDGNEDLDNCHKVQLLDRVSVSFWGVSLQLDPRPFKRKDFKKRKLLEFKMKLARRL